MKGYALLLTVVALASVAGPGKPVLAAVTKTFTIREPVGLAWGPDRVNYPVEFPEGQVIASGLALRDAAGNPVAAQLSDLTLWPGTQSVKSATLSFMVSLQPDEVSEWTLTAGNQAVPQPATDLAVNEREEIIELTTSRVGLRLVGGERQFPAPEGDASRIPAPIQGLRLSDGRWIGRGWWQTDRPCLGYRAQVVERGPVFARVALRYDFADNTAYTATVELSAGQDLAVIREEFNLSQGKRYPMPELAGAKPTDLFEYVLPHFDPPERGQLWDWWGGTHGRVPSPNCYNFSFYEGLEPERCEWHGRMYHVLPGTQGSHDTPIAYDRDGRWTSINAFLQWGDDETLYFGAYGSKSSDEVAIIGLRPSQWVHPDVNPHPIATIVQWTQTNNLWIERRQTPDLFLRAPTCLGRRVYGIGVLQRREQADGDKTSVTSQVMLRHIRFGRQRLDEVKDWVLDYAEPAKYPRLLVEPGDLARMQARARGNGLTEDGFHYWIGYLLRGDAETGKRLIADVTQRLYDDCRRIATQDWDHNSYAMSRPWHAQAADVALAVPEITPEEASRLRRYLALTAYNCLSPDYVPPREAGFGWGSANMMEALRCRGAALMVALLPNHPQAPAWREFLARYVIANAREKINPAGATLEIGAYGAMAIEFATVPYLALSHSDPGLDFSALLPLLRAAARFRMSYLTPYDVRGGYRAPAPIGDSPYHPEYAFGLLAAALEKTDPDLHRQLIWAIREGGLRMNGADPLPGLLFDPDAPAEPPDLVSQWFPGSGFVMRSGFPSPEETYVNINAGAFAIGHGHSDRGAFILYAKGAPLMLDFGSQYVPNIGEAWLHNGGLTFDHEETLRPCPGRDQPGCYFTGKVWTEHQTEPFTCLEPGWAPDAPDLDTALGKATAFAALPAADYGEMTRRISYLDRVPYMLEDLHGQFLGRGATEPVYVQQPFDWVRRYVFVKDPDPLGPNYLVMRDDLSGNRDLRPALNFWCLADALEVQGQRATYTGQHGVDLDLYVAEPTAFIHRTHRAGHKSGRDFAAHYEQTFGKPFEEYQTLFQIPQAPGGGYFVALVPRKREQPAPRFATVLGGRGIQVSFPDRMDTVIIMNRPEQVTWEGLSLRGTVFVITKAAGRLSVTMLAPGEVRRGDRVLMTGNTAMTVETR